MDELIKKTAGFGIPGLILIIAMSSTGLSGAAALTASLALLGPFGMIGGVAFLGFIAFSADKISEFGIETIAKAVVKEQLKSYTKSEITTKIKRYPITKGMKLKIIDFINKS